MRCFPERCLRFYLARRLFCVSHMLHVSGAGYIDLSTDEAYLLNRNAGHSVACSTANTMRLCFVLDSDAPITTPHPYISSWRYGTCLKQPGLHSYWPHSERFSMSTGSHCSCTILQLHTCSPAAPDSYTSSSNHATPCHRNRKVLQQPHVNLQRRWNGASST